MDLKNIILQRDIQDGESVVFSCKPGFFQQPNKNMRVSCLNGKLDYPECGNKKGEGCGPAPFLANGDVEGTEQRFYKTDTSVKYKCQNYHVMVGSPVVTCQNGAWSTLPDCLGPCQVTAEKQDEHGVELKRKSKDTVSFIEGASIEFICKSGFKTPTPKSLTVECTADGFEYPTCISTVPCRLTQEAMDEKKLELHEKHNGEVLYTHGQTIEFKCKSGLVPIPPLSVKCIQTKITYPMCAPANTCILLQEKMIEYSIQLLPGTERKIYLENSEQITFSCKEGFEKHPTSGDLTQKCVAGIIAYPICIHSGVLV